jgi:hypothetical protein
MKNMNDSKIDDDARFDRLVDGELSLDEYQALLASLDDEPGGWRRCALAFLEAQALKSELSGVLRGLDLRREETKEILIHQAFAASSRKLSFRHLSNSTPVRVLAMAASFLLVFVLGIVAPRLVQHGMQEMLAGGNNSSPVAVALNDQQPRLRSSGSQWHQSLRPVANVPLMMDGVGGASGELGQVPVFDVGQDAERFLRESGRALAPELVQLLEQRGHRVEQRQQYIPFQLDDGRQGIVPVEQIQITPVSRRAY